MVSSTQTSWPLGEEEEGGSEERQDEQKKGKDRRGR